MCRVANVRMLTKSCPVATLNVVQVIAVLCQELGVGGVECQSVATGLDFRHSAVAFPIFVARVTVGVESIVIRALEVLLSQYCKKIQVFIVRVPRRLCYTGLFISPSGISELDYATTKTDTAERNTSIGRESLQVFFCTRGLGVLPGSTARG